MSLKAFHRFYMQVICMHAYVYNTVTQELVCVCVCVRTCVYRRHACSTHTLVNDMKFYQYKFVFPVLIVSKMNFLTHLLLSSWEPTTNFRKSPLTTLISS